MKTRSAYVKAPWQVEIREVELPDTPPAGWVTLKVDACGICGTDITTAANSGGWQSFGHEIAGTILNLDPGCPGHLKAGDRVLVESASFCGHCDDCRNARPDRCSNQPAGFWGAPAMGFSEHTQVPACGLVQYDGMTPEVGTLVEPAGVGFDLVKVADIQMGDSVCVVGPGPIGLVAAALARHRGAAEVVCIGQAHDTKRLQVAESCGAKAMVVTEPLDQRADLKGRFNHVLMTAPPPCIPPGLALLKYEGIMTFLGIGHGQGVITFDADNFHFRKLQLRASFASPAMYFPNVLKLIKAGIIPADKLISHVFGLKDMAKALQTCRDDRQNTVKVVVQC